MKRFLALAVLIPAMFLSGCGGDSVDGCAEKIYHEGLLNIADKDRVVVKNLSTFSECDGLSKSDQVKARSNAEERILAIVFG